MNYWQRRQQQLNKQLEKDEEKLKKRLSSYFDAEYRKLERQIAAYYKQYGMDNVIQYRRLMETLSDTDRRLLMEQMDVFAEKYPEYAYLMPVRESIYKLNRLEGLQYSVRMQQLEIGAVENQQITAHLSRNAERGVNAAAEALGFGKNFYANNPDISKMFVNVPWSNGENFSQKIWNNTTKLANYLNSDIAQGIARGDTYEKLVRRLRERFSKVSRNDAYRLIYTEGTYVMAEATMRPFTEDFEKYRLSTVGDGKVCDICRSVSQETFEIRDRQPGVNFPPMHPWCRCSFTIEVDDWDKWMEEYEKRHRNAQSQKVVNRLNDEKKDDIIRLPRYKEAVIPKAKFMQYALNPEKDLDKARAFEKALGYTVKNADDLIEQINEKLSDYEAVEKGDRGWGMTYEVVMDITGPNGKTAKVLTGWIDDKNNGEMRLTTVHIDR
ncbi:MAG TPA: minor capsid protein [Candidatus Mediterraneibacter cottocaccae]|nr:minor capsid protein [Candidatus Mediterraneibacter cottocaccae]